MDEGHAAADDEANLKEEELAKYADNVEEGLMALGGEEGQDAVGDEQDKADEEAADKTAEEMVEGYKSRIYSLKGAPDKDVELLSPEQDHADRQD